MSLKRKARGEYEENIALLEVARAEKRSKHSTYENERHLLQLLDFSATELLSQSDIQQRFDDIAACLLHNCILTYDDTSTGTPNPIHYDILEIEFYLFKEKCHEDPFTHADDVSERRISGEWRFHKAPRQFSISSRSSTTGSPKPSIAGGYRGGTRKGLDLSLGASPRLPLSKYATTSRFFAQSEANNCPESGMVVRGGVLLRSIRRISDAHVISGPSLLVDELLRVGTASNIAELVQARWSGNVSAFRSFDTVDSIDERGRALFLQSRSSMSTFVFPQIYCSPRIGLDLSHASTKLTPQDNRILYIFKPYRYFIHPHLLVANGRGHTFLGVYEHTARLTQSEDDVIQKVIATTGLQEKTVMKYLAEYRMARHSSSLKSFIGSSGKGATASPAGFLRVVGAVKRYLEEHSA